MRKALAFVLVVVSVAFTFTTLGAQQGRGQGEAAQAPGQGRGPAFPPEPTGDARPKPMAGDAVERADPALDAIISSSAKLEMLKEDYFGISEGPVWIPDGQGYLLFSDIAGNCIYKWTPDGKLSVFLRNSGFTGNNGILQGYIANSGHLLIANIGSNGITVDPQGRLVFTAQGDRAIIRLEKDGTRTVLADKFQGIRFNRPNDVVVKSDGSVYFTDVNLTNNPSSELHQSGIYRIKTGAIDIVANDVPVNGLAFSPDEKVFYIAAGGQLAAYDVRPDGTLMNRRVFIDFSVDTRPGGPDGMKVDTKGNVYSTGPGGIWIMSSTGKHLGTVKLPTNATNLAFGDQDGKMLYITDRFHLMRIKLNVAGIIPGPPR